MNRMNHACCADAGTAAIVSIPMQRMGKVFPVQAAIRHGTLFPELFKPALCAGSPSVCAEPSAAQTSAFAAWEVRLYLNTHPDDTAALQLYRQLCQQAKKPNYACTFSACGGNRWTWVDDPWPWEYEANGGRA